MEKHTVFIRNRFYLEFKSSDGSTGKDPIPHEEQNDFIKEKMKGKKNETHECIQGFDASKLKAQPYEGVIWL